jgi:hypothetical protein
VFFFLIPYTGIFVPGKIGHMFPYSVRLQARTKNCSVLTLLFFLLFLSLHSSALHFLILSSLLCSALLISSLLCAALLYSLLSTVHCAGIHRSSPSAQLVCSPHSSPLHFLILPSLLCSGIHLSSLLCSALLISSLLCCTSLLSPLYSTLCWYPSLLPPLLSSSYLLTRMLCTS